jgi:hypothetical protein
MGIVTKNAIMLVDFAIEEIAAGVKRNDAIIDAGRKRARPIVTTTKELLELGDWLEASHCTHVAMEATGSYWNYRSGNCDPHGGESRVASPQNRRRRAVRRSEHGQRITGGAEGGLRSVAEEEAARAGGDSCGSFAASMRGSSTSRTVCSGPSDEGGSGSAQDGT